MGWLVQVFMWISQNSEFVLALLGIILAMLKNRYDRNKDRIEAQAKREDFERNEQSKRESHQQQMEREQAEDIRKRREWFQTQIEHQAKQIIALEKRNDELLKKVSELTIANSLQIGNINSLNAQVEDNQHQLSEMRQEIRHYQTENGQLISENGRLNDLLAEERESNAIMRDLNKSHIETITKLNQDISSLDTQLRIAESTIASQSELLKSLTKDDDTQDIPHLDDDGNPIKVATPEEKSSDNTTQNDNDKTKEDIA
jgi:chromosome segregation ATPase